MGTQGDTQRVGPTQMIACVVIIEAPLAWCRVSETDV